MPAQNPKDRAPLPADRCLLYPAQLSYPNPRRYPEEAEPVLPEQAFLPVLYRQVRELSPESALLPVPDLTFIPVLRSFQDLTEKVLFWVLPRHPGWDLH